MLASFSHRSLYFPLRFEGVFMEYVLEQVYATVV